MANVFLGIGSNLGDRQTNIDRAIAFLKEHEDIRVLAISKIIETEPVGGPPQDAYLNGAIQIVTDLLPLELLSCLKMIERRLGRPSAGRAGIKKEIHGPRTMDLDILFYNDVVIVEGKSIQIPHPRLHERTFVLEPLLEIAPNFVHPRFKKSVKELLDELLNLSR